MKRTRPQVEREFNNAINRQNFILAGILKAELQNMPKETNSMPPFFEELFNKGGKPWDGERR